MVNPKIFISYRRADSQDFTDRLFDYMAKHFGTENVFQDVGDSSKIPLGVDFVEYLADQVRACDIVLVVIGEQWTRILKERAKLESDFVRIEVESALAQGKLVIPVLKSATQMPTRDDLPESIEKLARLNASRVRPNPDFVRDCEILADGIKAGFNKQAPAPPKSQPSPPPMRPPSESLMPAPGKPTIESLMPDPFAWIEIPGGRGEMKTYRSKVTLTIPTEKYWMSKYPITNAQFAKFLKAGGYNEKRWWTDAGWEAKAKGWTWNSSRSEWQATGEAWIEPRYWRDSKWNGSEQPVVGVSWYESVAFSLWLSDVTGEQIRLPTENQWQYAAQGADGRDYPWFKKWDTSRCNNNVNGKGIGKTTLVRQYEGKGDSPFGVVDMAGNVWEWCLTDYDNKTNDSSSNATNRVLRGGSWYYFNLDRFRCDYCFWNNPHVRDYYFGFRVSRS